MKSLARFAYRRRWVILAVWVVLFLGMNALSQSFGTAYANTFTLPGTNSTHALKLLQSNFKSKSGDVDEIVLQARTGTIASHKKEIDAMVKRVEKVPAVASVISPFVGGSFQTSKNDKIAFAVVYFSTQGYKLKSAQIQPVENAGITARSSSLNVQFAGNAFEQLAAQKGSPDVIFGLILTAIVLILAFGSLFSMLLPLLVGLVAVGTATAVTTLLSHGLSIATFAPILGSLIGLGVGIDYALFIVTRCRQGLKRGLSPEEAVVTSINTSGRAVLFAGLTVCIALLGMLVLQLSFLNGVAIAASLTVLITMAASLTFLPALLGFWGFRILSRKERRALAEHGPEPIVTNSAWQRWANTVSRHPRKFSLVALIAIVLVCVPFFSLHLGSSDAGTDPASSTTRQAYDLLATGFGPGVNGPLQVVGAIHNNKDLATMQTLDQKLQGKPDVHEVAPLQISSNGKVAVINVVPQYESRLHRHRESHQHDPQRLHPRRQRQDPYRHLRRRTDRDLRGLRHGLYVEDPPVRRRDRPARMPVVDGGLPKHRHTVDGRGDEHLRRRCLIRPRRRGLPVGLG